MHHLVPVQQRTTLGRGWNPMVDRPPLPPRTTSLMCQTLNLPTVPGQVSPLSTPPRSPLPRPPPTTTSRSDIRPRGRLKASVRAGHQQQSDPARRAGLRYPCRESRRWVETVRGEGVILTVCPYRTTRASRTGSWANHRRPQWERSVEDPHRLLLQEARGRPSLPRHRLTDETSPLPLPPHIKARDLPELRRGKSPWGQEGRSNNQLETRLKQSSLESFVPCSTFLLPSSSAAVRKLTPVRTKVRSQSDRTHYYFNNFCWRALLSSGYFIIFCLFLVWSCWVFTLPSRLHSTPSSWINGVLPGLFPLEL